MAGFERLGVLDQIIDALSEMGWLLQTPVSGHVCTMDTTIVAEFNRESSCTGFPICL